ncbi:MAG: purine-nucleoside phosphorylase [Planctomycetes bacterium]|nr:purine-nucleoside phosphorylase [Planctomycetota bacterium]
MSNNSDLIEHLDLAGDFIRLRLGDRPIPKLAVVLGSGLGPVADQVTDPVVIPYTDVPYFPESTVTGHAGRLVIGALDGTPVVCLQGRFHLYEGYAAHQVVFPLRALGRMGVQAFVLTNAAGGINTGFSPGDLMVITDHLNLSGTNPMIGSHDDALGPRFPDMGQAYDPEFQAVTHALAAELGIKLQQGVYTVLSGPSYETPAEVRMLRGLGGDAVGMSTVPEVIACRQMGLRVLGISLISNLAAGLSQTPLSHKEVIETAARVQQDFVRLIEHLVPRLGATLG